MCVVKKTLKTMSKQMQMFYRAEQKIADRDNMFMYEILPTITRAEFEILCKKRPELYERYRGLVYNTVKD